MLLFVTFSSLVVIASCNICCTPKQWEGAEYDLLGTKMVADGTITQIQSSVNISYDAINKRAAATEYLEANGYPIMVKIILDYTSGVQYTINGTQCIKNQLGAFQEFCIPDSATKAGTATFGAGSSTLDVSSYQTTVQDINFSVSVTSTGCIPVGELIYGTYGGQYFFQSTSYNAITPGIRDESVFTPPASCMQGPIYPAVYNMMSVRRFGMI